MDESVFPGEPTPLPAPVPQSPAVLRPAAEKPADVKHVLGYTPFVDFARASGHDPRHLASNLEALLHFLEAQARPLAHDSLLEPTAIFFGNAIAATHPRATWSVFSEPEIGTHTISIPVRTAVRALLEHPEQHEGFLHLLGTWTQLDHDDDEARRLGEIDHESLRDLVLPSTPFRRPNRAQPSAEVAALAAYLTTHYTASTISTLSRNSRPVARITPESGAPLTITATASGARLTAGLLYGHHFSWSQRSADPTELEQAVLGIAGGGLREIYPVGARRWTHVTLRYASGSTSSNGALDPALDPLHISDGLSRLSNGWWPAWPLREQ